MGAIDEDDPNCTPTHFEPVMVSFYLASDVNFPACSIDFKNFKINKGTVIWLNGKPKGAYTKIKLADNNVQEFIEGLDAKALCM